MGFSWIPKQPEFFDMFDETAELVVKAADVLVDLAEHLDCPGRRVGDLTELEAAEIDTFERLGCLLDILHAKARRVLSCRRSA